MVRRLIISIAVLSAIVPVALYLLFFVGEQKISMAAEANIFAQTITDEINNNPEYWQYEDIRFSSILRHRLPDGNIHEHRQLFDSKLRLVAENKASQLPPLINLKISVFDAGEPVGTLKITRSIRSILHNAFLVFLLSSLCGMLVYFILHIFPLRVLRSAFAALHKEKEQATVTLHSIADAVVTTDTSLQILSLNPAAERLAGIQSTGIIGSFFPEHFEIIDSLTQEKIDHLLEDCLQLSENRRAIRRQAIFIRRLDSCQFQVEVTVSALHDEHSRLMGLVIVLHDVTAARLLEKQIKAKVLELALIVKYAGVGIAYVRRGVIVEVNTIASKIVGIPPEAIIGQKAADILTSYLGYSESVDHIYDQLLKSETFDVEFQAVRSDSKRIWLRLIGQGVDPSQLRESGTVWIVQDITESKHHQDELRLAKHRAEEASRFKSEFIAHLNHELRNPLGGIIGMNRLVLETELTPVQLEYLTIVQDTAETLLLMINNLLDLSKIESGVMELEEKSFRIESIYDYVSNVLASRLKEKGLYLTFSISEAVPPVLIGDELRLGQILLNLVGNALKFTSTGGISVLCERISQSNTSIQLQFNVTDTGCGIDEPARKKVFDAFVQASGSVARTHGGTGLGLSICKKLTELMGGEIWLESKPGEGSTFYFTCNFKCKKQFEIESIVEDEKTQELAEEQRQQSKRVLLVEDIAFNQVLVKLLLEQEKHFVQVASNGREALKSLAESTFDAILMDVQMPLMDGLTATRLIRRCEREQNPQAREGSDLMAVVSSWMYGKHVPIIGMTGNSTEEGRLECIAAGMDLCISKPIDRQEMLHVLDMACEELV